MLGSPPPMRGKGKKANCSYSVYRITPAYAGKSVSKCDIFRTAQDHPRLCGEKKVTTTPESRKRGSPPPMRGKGSKKHFIHLPIGITPAYAGKRYLKRGTISQKKDHPRLCGEKRIC